MDEKDQKSWAAQPDVCRCCLSTSGTWDLTVAYITDSGSKEVYADMLTECFGISFSLLHKWGSSRAVCEACVGRLRGAFDFKNRVQRAEQVFLDYHSRKDVQPPSDVNPEWDSTGVNSDDVSLIKSTTTNRNAKGKRQKIKPKGKKESDTPISEIVQERSNTEILPPDNKDTEKQRQPRTAPLKEMKQLSQRKRVILTCGTLLRDTTACPFRHHKSWFQCFFCSQDFMDMTTLRDHTLEHHGDIEAELKKMKRYPRSLQIDISNFECRECNLKLTDVNVMRRHFEVVHNKVIYNECIADYKINSSPYTCHLCDKEFHVFRTLSTHLNEHYANCICDVCGRSFINSKRLKVHNRTHERGQFPCSVCGKVLNTKMSRANHIESAHSKRVIKCQICLKPMKHYNDRIKHMSEVHNITHKFKCPICSREYNIKHYLATHIRQTHGNKNKKCSECGMAFITNHGLKKHMLKHSGERSFSCSVCSKTYARSYTLREHMRAHEISLGPVGIENNSSAS